MFYILQPKHESLKSSFIFHIYANTLQIPKAFSNRQGLAERWVCGGGWRGLTFYTLLYTCSGVIWSFLFLNSFH